MAWFKRFVDPIVLPDGHELLTLRDAAEYITTLPTAEHDAADWQVARETLRARWTRNVGSDRSHEGMHGDTAPEPQQKSAKGFRIVR